MKRQFPWMQTCTVNFVIGDWSITHMQTQFPHLTHSETHMNLASYIINQHRMPYKNKGYEFWWFIYLPEWDKRDSFHLVHKIGLQINLHISILHNNKKQNNVIRVTVDVSANGSDLVQYVNFHNWLTNNISPGCKMACLLIDITLSRNMKVVNNNCIIIKAKIIPWLIDQFPQSLFSLFGPKWVQTFCPA